jgi:hypothetical protein
MPGSSQMKTDSTTHFDSFIATVIFSFLYRGLGVSESRNSGF